MKSLHACLPVGLAGVEISKITPYPPKRRTAFKGGLQPTTQTQILRQAQDDTRSVSGIKVSMKCKPLNRRNGESLPSPCWRGAGGEVIKTTIEFIHPKRKNSLW